MNLPDFTSISVWFDLGLGLLVAALFTILLFRITNRKFVLFYSLLGVIALILSWLFSLDLLRTILAIVLTTSAIVVLFVNISRIRPLIASEMKGKMLFTELSSRLVTGPLSKKEVNACFTNHSCDNHYDARLREKFFFNYFKCGHIKTLKKFYLIEKFKSVITKMKYYCVAIAKRIRCIFNVKK